MEDWIKSYIENAENKNDDEIYYELVNKFDFQMGSYMESVFVESFGYLLANLPEEVFKSLLEKKNLYIRPGLGDGGNVLVLKVNNDIKKGETLQILTVSVSDFFGEASELIGILAHELAHIFAGHIGGSREIEREADEIASSWGFDAEIKASRGI